MSEPQWGERVFLTHALQPPRASRHNLRKPVLGLKGKASYLGVLARHEDLWEEMLNFEEFVDKVAAADSLEQVCTIFREFHVL